MGCGNPKEKIEDEILQMRMERSIIQMERQKQYQLLKGIDGHVKKRPLIPDYIDDGKKRNASSTMTKEGKEAKEVKKIKERKETKEVIKKTKEENIKHIRNQRKSKSLDVKGKALKLKLDEYSTRERNQKKMHTCKKRIIKF